jgi:hypothetical protein
VEDEARRFQFENFLGGDGVDAELQVATRFGFFIGFTRFVIDDLHLAAS